MNGSQPHTEILGFTLHGPPPLGTVHMPFAKGMSILYGPNGAGKTTILNSLSAALRGVDVETEGYWEFERWLAMIHVRLVDIDAAPPGNEPRERWEDPLAKILVDHIVGEVDTVRRARDEPVLRPKFDDTIPDNSDFTTRDVLREATRLRSPYDTGGQGLFSLISVGWPHRPEWIVWSSARADEQSPVFTADLDDSIAWTVFANRLANMPDRSSHDLTELLTLAGPPGPSPEAIAELIESIDAPGATLDRVLEWTRGNSTMSELAMPGVRELMRSRPLLNQATDDRTTSNWIDQGIQRRLWSLFEDMFSGETPAWVPVPLWNMVTVSDLPLPRVLDPGHENIEAEITSTLRYLRGKRQFQRIPDNDSAVGEHRTTLPSDSQPLNPYDIDGFREGAEPILARLTAFANSFLDEAAPARTEVSCSFLSVDDWLDGRPIGVFATDLETGHQVALGNLSSAQQRWVTIALLFGIAQLHDEEPTVLLIDEPEAALHRRAARETARRLSQFTSRHGLTTYIASHSEPFLSARDAHLFHVTRKLRTGLTEVVPLDRLRLDDLTHALDLEVGEVLQLTRVFVLVEGDHDKEVLEAILGDELDEAYAKVLPIRGTKGLTTLLDSEILLRYTDSRLVVVLDHISEPEQLANAWAKARNMATDDPTNAARVFGAAIAKIQARHKPTGEDMVLTDLAFKFLKSSHPSRVDIFGFTKPGIEKYLPIRSFTDDPRLTWELLDDEFMSPTRDRRPNENEKDWLGRVHGIDIRTETIGEAATTMDSTELSDEFLALARVIRSAAEQ